jgi:2-polyprenyl-6-methoxyphenol hydroxylase-like FAD-dependent oxidoreductase
VVVAGSGGVSEATGAEVLIIGAGPSGLFAALELARHGVRARVIESAPVPHRQARATALQPGTLEILAQAGIADQVVAESEHVQYSRLYDARLSCTSELPFAGAGSSWEFQCSLPQWRTEQILADRLTELGGTVERGVTAVSMQRQRQHVLVGLRHADGNTRTVEASWVIGAGGARSVTRDSMAEILAGATYPGTAMVADLRLASALPRDGSALIASPAGYMFLAPLPDERWISFVGDLSAGEEDLLGRTGSQGGGASLAAVSATIRRRISDGIDVEHVAWAAPFRMHRRLAPRLADGRRFLLGDAGHLSSPFGGEGLNCGLHDAHNLAWKLALALRGQGGAALVDSFAAERRPAARHILDVSDRLHAMAKDAVAAARTGRFVAPPSAREAAALTRSRCMLDVSYAYSPLTGEYLGAEGAGAAASDTSGSGTGASGSGGSGVGRAGAGRAGAGRRTASTAAAPEMAAVGSPGAPQGPAPGERYRGRASLTGRAHHLLLFGVRESAATERLARRWRGLVEISRPGGGRQRAGLDGRGGPAAVLVRPDGYIGFRALPADRAGLEALDAHLRGYLTPA